MVSIMILFKTISLDYFIIKKFNDDEAGFSPHPA